MSSKVNIFIYICLSFGLYFVLNEATPFGAPPAACAKMTPQHKLDPQTSPSPFATSPESTQIVKGSSVKLTLASTNSTYTFKGFLVMGFDNSNKTEGPIGSFSAVSDGKTINCPGDSLKNAATHRLNNTKSSVTVDWNAPEGFVGSVLFKTTFVQEFTTFWVQTLAPLVQVV